MVAPSVAKPTSWITKSLDQLVMLGQAELSQDGNVIKGSSIKYQIAQQKLIADSSHNERVTTVLQPSRANN